MITSVIEGAMLHGMEAVPVRVSVQLENSGIPGLSITGMRDAEAVELRSRVRCALRSSGYEVPRRGGRVALSVEGGRMRPAGAQLALPIALAILEASGQVPALPRDGALFVGDLNLDGRIDPVRGGVAYQRLAREMGTELVTSPETLTTDLDGLSALAWRDLSQARAGIGVAAALEPHDWMPSGASEAPGTLDLPGRGAAEALVAALAGGHGMLVMADDEREARRVAEAAAVLAGASRDGSVDLEAVTAASVTPGCRECGVSSVTEMGPGAGLASLVGGGRPVKPGLLTTSLGGALYLPAYEGWLPATAGPQLVEPMAEGEVSLIRADGPYRLPANRAVIAACPAAPEGLSPAALDRYRRSASSSLAAGGAALGICLALDGGPRETDAFGTAELLDAIARTRAFAAEHPDRPLAGAVDPALRVARTLADMRGSLEVGDGDLDWAEVLSTPCALAGRAIDRSAITAPAAPGRRVGPTPPSTRDIKSVLAARAESAPRTGQRGRKL